MFRRVFDYISYSLSGEVKNVYSFPRVDYEDTVGYIFVHCIFETRELYYIH